MRLFCLEWLCIVDCFITHRITSSFVRMNRMLVVVSNVVLGACAEMAPVW